MSAPARSLRDVEAVADTFVELARSFHRARARMLAAAAHDVEWSAHVVLRCLATEGPMRSSALADCIQSDPSTVSRQVAALVKDGLLERRADPDDGRASLLVPTTKAQAVLAEHDKIRIQHFDRMLHDWSDRDLREFAALLGRFTTDFENANHAFLAENQLAERQLARRAPNEEGTA
ncbi:MAG: MarR family transcriptional regulator [Actinomycetota bacterium]|nr:MarR family transcriptional regulator [Actinomycetota bacterium]